MSKPARRRLLIVTIAFLVICLLCWHFFGFYSIQPIGAIPAGKTLLVRRTGDEPFFNSPDGTCLRRMGSVSLICRMGAISNAPLDRIILRLPYMSWAYRPSTGGAEYDR